MDLSNTVLGFRKLGAPLGEDFVTALRQRLRSAAEQARPDARELAHLLMAFVRLGEAPEEEAMGRVLAALGPYALQSASIQSLGMLCWAVARFVERPPEGWVAAVAAAGLGQVASAGAEAPEAALHVAMLLQVRAHESAGAHACVCAFSAVRPRMI